MDRNSEFRAVVPSQIQFAAISARYHAGTLREYVMSQDSANNPVNKNRDQILEAGLRGEEVTLTGIVVPGELDANFKMISVLFSSDQELDFLVEPDARGNELFGHLRKPLRVKGLIREDEKGRRTIRISSYELQERDRKETKTKIRDR